VPCHEANFITCLNAPKRPKERVTMTRHGGVAFLPGQRRVRKMAHRHLQRVFVIAFGHDNGETDARDLETSDRGRRLNGPLDAIRCANGLGMDERVI